MRYDYPKEESEGWLNHASFSCKSFFIYSMLKYSFLSTFASPILIHSDNPQNFCTSILINFLGTWCEIPGRNWKQSLWRILSKTPHRYVREHTNTYEYMGSFSNDYGDGKENAKKTIALLSKTSSLYVHHAFLCISLPLRHDYDVKIPNFMFHGVRN